MLACRIRVLCSSWSLMVWNMLNCAENFKRKLKKKTNQIEELFQPETTLASTQNSLKYLFPVPWSLFSGSLRKLLLSSEVTRCLAIVPCANDSSKPLCHLKLDPGTLLVGLDPGSLPKPSPLPWLTVCLTGSSSTELWGRTQSLPDICIKDDSGRECPVT